MRVSFNPIIKNNFYNKTFKNNVYKKQVFNEKPLMALECLAINNIAFCATMKNPAIYAISRDNAILKFENKTAASETLGCNFASITKCLEGKFHESNGYAFLYADDVEIQKEDGSIELDEKLIKKIREGFANAKTTPVYALSMDGSVQRFDSLAVASDELEISVSTISKSLLKSGHTAGKYVFVSANDLELRDEKGAVIYNDNGQPVLNNEVKKAELERFSHAYRGPVCSIDCFGNIRRYEDENEAFNYSSNKVATLRDVNEKGKVYLGQIYVQENVIISRDEQGYARYDKDGNYIYDISKINKILEAFEDVKIKPVKAIDIITGEVIEFKSSTEAACILNIKKQAIHAVLKGKNKTASGYKFEYLYPRTIKNYTLIQD